MAAAISLQVDRRSVEFRVSKAAGLPYEHNARRDAQRRCNVKRMGEAVVERSLPTEKRGIL